MGETTLIPSHRATTSSRTPGRVNQGTVWLLPAGLRLCKECDRLCYDHVLIGHHAPHVRRIDGEHRVVNCSGRVLELKRVGT